MIKFIDYAPYLLESLDFPMSRFQAEGGEHLNYTHNIHYFQHTTRHGGKNLVDPQLSILITMYRNLSYEIMNSESCEDFKKYVRKHIAACKIQAMFRGHLIRKLFAAHAQEENKILKSIELIQCPTKPTLHPTTGIFSEMTFMLVGNIHKQPGLLWTHSTLENKIISLGGKVIKNLPGKTKGRSSKIYDIIINAQAIIKSKKVPDSVREVHRRYTILDYRYVFKCIEDNLLINKDAYKPDLGNILGSINQEPTLHQQHFCKKKRMISLMKKQNESLTKGYKHHKVPANVALFYAHLKRKEQQNDTCHLLTKPIYLGSSVKNIKHCQIRKRTDI